MANDIDGVLNEIDQVTADVQEAFGVLSAEQLNWRPAPESWSVAQSLDHLIRSNEEFFPEFDSLAAGTRKNTFWQTISPLSGIAGVFLVKTLKSDGQKVKTNQKMTPPSDVGGDIVKRFVRHQDELKQKVLSIAAADWNKVVLTSPFIKIMTYRLGTGLEALIEHEKRHLRQAKRVVETEGFPK